ncbi:major facilitator family protein [Cystoisospora suis]|uniref:Major facilitator family protein n=1 Tax=Cystoisospora suis TaxID=483139 RepID=A0A2C6KWV5_9APIC|nr:major facilitator family protein [Cystoisospora suis]
MPRSALNFIVMFFQYAGLSDWEASFTVSASWLAAMLVAPFVGCLGDAVHRRYPNKGRPVMAQSAILIRSFLMFVILSCIPKKRESFLLFLFVSSLIGLMAGWPGVGVNRPILTEIVLPKHRATVFSLFSTMEGVGSALLGSPVVGLLAQKVFGYSQPLKKSSHSHRSSSTSSPPPPSPSDASSSSFSSQRETDEKNAEALSLALICTTVGPWILSVGVYFLLHCTYTADRQAAALAARKLEEEDERQEEEERRKRREEEEEARVVDLEGQHRHQDEIVEKEEDDEEEEEERDKKTRLERKHKRVVYS